MFYVGKGSSMQIDIYNADVENIGTKEFRDPDPSIMLNKWVNRPKATIVSPPLKNALEIQSGKIYSDKTTKYSMGYMVSHCNDIYNSQQKVLILSLPYYQNLGWSITPTNFLNSLTVMAVRRLVTMSWINERDQFYIPDTTLPDFDQFQHDCIIYSLFNGQNYTSSIPDIIYKTISYDIKNQFTWFPKDLIANHPLATMALSSSASRTIKERFTQKYIEKHRAQFSDDALEILELARQLIDVTMQYRSSAPPKYHLTDRWDAGWHQLRMGILHDKNIKLDPATTKLYADFKIKYKELRDRLRPKIYEYGFLDDPTL